MKPDRPPTLRARRHERTAATIHDVAAQAGVSVATVSRVLNGKEVVREETQRQVLAAAEALRYVPNVAARSLSIRRSHTIGILLPDVHGEFFSEVIRGIDVAARSEGYHILVSGSHSDVDEMLEVLEAMRGRVDGLVVMAPDVARTSLHRSLPSDLPLVLLSSTDEGRDAVTIDNYGGARAMMRHLAELGHVRIAFLKGPVHNMDARERLRGYRQGMRQGMRGLGVTAVRELRGLRRQEIGGDFTEASGYAAVLELLAMTPRPTALFAANDSMAVGALAALAEAGVRVPEEISVTGFDDIPIARYVSPPLTTIRVDIADLGRRAFGLLLDALSTPETPALASERRDCVTTNLVVRKSSCSPEISSRTGRKGEES
jgi:LacI family transcriptional regulator